MERHLLYKGIILDYTTWYCGKIKNSNSDSDSNGENGDNDCYSYEDDYDYDDDDDECDDMLGIVEESPNLFILQVWSQWLSIEKK